MEFEEITKMAMESGISETELMNSCNKGDTGFVTIGRKIFIKVEDVIELMLKRKSA